MKTTLLTLSLSALILVGFAQNNNPLSFKKGRGTEAKLRLNFNEACPASVPVIDSVYTKGIKSNVSFAAPDMLHCGEDKGYIAYAVTNGEMPVADVWTIYFHAPNGSAYKCTVASSDRASASVTYAAFDATVTGKNITCTWTTEQEINNYKVEVERSADGENYTMAAIVFGREENTDVKQSYKFTDKAAYLLHTSTVYYRLKQMDNDGNISYSKVLNVQLPLENNKGVAVK